MLKKNIYWNIKKILHENNITTKDIAEKLGITTDGVNKRLRVLRETGKVNTDFLFCISELAKIEIKNLF